jgi:hypothetical protein
LNPTGSAWVSRLPALTGTRIKQWICYRRDEKAIAAFKALLKKEI